MQKALIVFFLTEKKNNIDELNQLLSDGWKVISQEPMSGSQSNGSMSLVILEKL